jgi:hypothetical protein
MIPKLLLLATVSLIALSVSFAGGNKKKAAYEEPFRDNQPHDPNAPVARAVDPNWRDIVTDVGSPTTLSGFYDYQSNGGSVQHIRVNPANGNIHVTYMLATDSTAGGLNNSRRTGYAFSTNNGTTWNNFTNVQVPARRSGFPTIDLLRGTNAGLPAIANHNDPGGGIRTLVYVDSPEGSGAFSELNSPPLIQGGTDEPIWPYVAGASDGSIIISASRNTAATAHYTRTADFTTWSAYAQITEVTQSGGRYPVQANGTGRVGRLYNTCNPPSLTTGGNWWTESTNNGQTWSTPTNRYGFRVAGVDTFLAYVHSDFVYNGNDPLFVFSETHNTLDVDQISFWSQATGFKVAVPHDTVRYRYANQANPQRFHNLRTNFPSIGLSGSTIVITYQAFQPDTDRLGWSYSDLWYVASSNGGNTWGSPQRISNTPLVDERYPSVSKWNAPGQFNIVWSQKTKSGLFAFPGSTQAPGADTVRTSQMFFRVNPIVFGGTAVDDGNALASSFKLKQNYPNPFNPATKIDYTVGKTGPVSMKVYNTLGEEVFTLFNGSLDAGSYQLTFDGADLPSGVYIYKLTSGSYSESKKMILMR